MTPFYGVKIPDFLFLPAPRGAGPGVGWKSTFKRDATPPVVVVENLNYPFLCLGPSKKHHFLDIPRFSFNRQPAKKIGQTVRLPYSLSDGPVNYGIFSVMSAWISPAELRLLA